MYVTHFYFNYEKGHYERVYKCRPEYVEGITPETTRPMRPVDKIPQSAKFSKN
jgi:hypothetical protein